MFRLTKRLVTHATFVRFVSIVNSAVSNKMYSPSNPFATNATLKRLLARMNSSVACQLLVVLKTFSTINAHVFTAVSMHSSYAELKIFSHTGCMVISHHHNVLVYDVSNLLCKPFATHFAYIRSSFFIMWLLSDIITIIFSLHFDRTFA